MDWRSDSGGRACRARRLGVRRPLARPLFVLPAPSSQASLMAMLVRTSRVAVALFCLLLIYGPSEAVAQVVGSVTRVQKQAQIGSTPAVDGTPVSMNAEIRTGPGARLQITFRDETVLTLGENARVVVDRYVYNPGSSTGVMALNAAQGALRFATGKLGTMTNKDVTVTTPQAALAVRGTEFWAGFVPGDLEYGVLLLSGAVDVGNSVGNVTLSEPGQGTDIPPALKDDYGPSDAYIWPEDKVARALATTQFGLAFGPQNLLPGLLALPFVLRDDDNGRPTPASP